MASWTIPDDVIDAWIGEDAPTDTVKIQKWIDRAERVIRRKVPTFRTGSPLRARKFPRAPTCMTLRWM